MSAGISNAAAAAVGGTGGNSTSPVNSSTTSSSSSSAGNGSSNGGSSSAPPGPPLLYYPHPSYPLALSALAAAERISNKNSSIADLRLKARKHAEALGITSPPT